MKVRTKIMLTFLFIVLSTSLYAQEESIETETNGFTANIGADVVSTYIWRGQKLDDLAVQPGISIGYKGFELGAWGSTSLVGTGYKELDLSLSYTIGGFSAVFTDYWCGNDSYNSFNYSDTTLHTFEFGLGYDFGFLSVSWYTNLWGAMGSKANGDDAYSSYFEVAAPFKLGDLEWQAAMGITPWENDYYGAEKFALINIGLTATKKIEFEKFTLPLYAQLTANPTAKKMYLSFGVTF